MPRVTRRPPRISRAFRPSGCKRTEVPRSEEKQTAPHITKSSRKLSGATGRRQKSRQSPKSDDEGRGAPNPAEFCRVLPSSVEVPKTLSSVTEYSGVLGLYRTPPWPQRPPPLTGGEMFPFPPSPSGKPKPAPGQVLPTIDHVIPCDNMLKLSSLLYLVIIC